MSTSKQTQPVTREAKPDPKPVVRKRRQTAAEKDRALLAEGQKREKAQRAEAARKRQAAATERQKGLGKDDAQATHESSDAVSERANQLVGEGKRPSEAVMQATAEAEEAEAKRQGLASPKATADMAKLAERSAEAVKDRSLSADQVKGAGKHLLDTAGKTVYFMAPYDQRLHKSGASSRGMCVRCEKHGAGRKASTSAALYPKGHPEKVRGFRAYCDEHAVDYSATYAIPMPGQQKPAAKPKAAKS
jgi:hypothetical protein